MARIRGVYLRKPPKGPSTYTSKEEALVASPTMLVADAAFPKHKSQSVKNAAFRVNSGSRGEWSPSEFFAIWEYARDIVLRVLYDDADDKEGVEVLGFVRDGNVIGEDGESLGALESLMEEDGVETGGWVLLVGVQPNVPEGWENVVGAPGSRRRRNTSQ